MSEHTVEKVAATFLLARIAEDESVARKATGGPSDWPIVTEEWVRPLHAPAADHIARHDPARVLAECEAKRRMIAQFSDVGWATYAARDVLFELLALPYAAHPDYPNEWRP